MKSNVKWIIASIIAVFAFIGVYFLYDNLSKKHSTDNFKENLAPFEGGETTKSSDSDSKEEEPDGESNTSNPNFNIPDFTVTDINGNEVKLSDYADKPIVLNFWASWCPPCRSEMPHFEEAYKKYPEVNFLMVNVTASQGESLTSAKNLITDNGYTFPVFFDTTGVASSVYGTGSLPTTFFIYKGGTSALYAVGALSMESLEEGIITILEQEK